MFRALLARIQQKHRTMRYPEEPPVLPDRFLGRPAIDCATCSCGNETCIRACPTDAIRVTNGIEIDLGRCLFCGECAKACTSGAIRFTTEHRLATNQRDTLHFTGKELQLATALGEKLRGILGRSLKLRQVSAGGCNACEADVNVLNTVGFDLGRFGIQFVASPRHADGILVTGPVTENMREALKKTYDAVAEPKIVIASGACAISGGPYIDHPEAHNGIGTLLPVDLYIPGCPPHPMTILDGLLRLVGRLAPVDPVPQPAVENG